LRKRDSGLTITISAALDAEGEPMINDIYFLFEQVSKTAAPPTAPSPEIRGYSRAAKPADGMIAPPGEKAAKATATYSAGEHFRILVSPLCVQFSHAQAVPDDLKAGERGFQDFLFSRPGVRVRRWIAVSWGWDDAGKKFDNVVVEGLTSDDFFAEREKRGDM
jgi:hypothetical protein